MPPEIRTTAPPSRLLAGVGLPALLLCGCTGGGGAPPIVPTITFGAPQLSPTGGADGRNLTIADVDRDGLPDALIANATLGRVSLLRGLPGGGFASGVAVPAPSLIGALLVADVSGDRRPDLVAASGAGADATIATGRGDGTFDAAAALGVPWTVGTLAVTDWNADGRADLVAAAAEVPAVALLPGLGGGAFGTPVVAATAFVVAGLAIGDFDGDRRPDVVCTGRGVRRIDVLRNDGVGGFLPPARTDVTTRGGALVCCDLDGDRRPDVVALDGDLTGATVFLGAGNASFTAGVTVGLAASGVDTLAAGDLDGDGATDLVAAAGNTVVAAYGDGRGGVSGAEVVRVEGGPVHALAVADLRGRGVLDVAYVLGGNHLAVLSNPRPPVDGLAGYGAGTPDCRGTIGMFANGVPTVGNADFGYVVTNAPADALGMMLLGGPRDVAGGDPFGVGVRLHLVLGFVFSRVVFSDPLGAAFVADPVPADPGVVGLEIEVQTLWLADPATTCSSAILGLASSRGLTVTIRP